MVAVWAEVATNLTIHLHQLHPRMPRCGQGSQPRHAAASGKPHQSLRRIYGSSGASNDARAVSIALESLDSRPRTPPTLLFHGHAGPAASPGLATRATPTMPPQWLHGSNGKSEVTETEDGNTGGRPTPQLARRDVCHLIKTIVAVFPLPWLLFPFFSPFRPSVSHVPTPSRPPSFAPQNGPLGALVGIVTSWHRA